MTMLQEKNIFFSGTLSIVLLTYCLIPYFINIIAGVCPSKDPPATLSGSKFSQKNFWQLTTLTELLVLLGQEYFVQTSNMAMNTGTGGAGTNGCND